MANTSSPEKQEVLQADLKAIFSQESKQMRLRCQALLKWMGVPVVWVCTLAFNADFLEQKWNSFPLFPWLVVGPPTVWFFWYFFKYLLASGGKEEPSQVRLRQQREWTRRVARLSDIHSVGLLVDAYGMADPEIREIATAALTSLLPNLQADDTPLLHASHRAKLCYVLNQRESLLERDVLTLLTPKERENQTIHFHIAILQALKQVGGREVLPVVRRLATEKPKTEGDTQIHREAIACLLLLEPRLKQALTSETLLRASDAPGMASDTLLRAATGSRKIAPEELLRASAASGTSENEEKVRIPE